MKVGPIEIALLIAGVIILVALGVTFSGYGNCC
jgi:hypothetical protein